MNLPNVRKRIDTQIQASVLAMLAATLVTALIAFRLSNDLTSTVKATGSRQMLAGRIDGHRVGRPRFVQALDVQTPSVAVDHGPAPKLWSVGGAHRVQAPERLLSGRHEDIAATELHEHE